VSSRARMWPARKGPPLPARGSTWDPLVVPLFPRRRKMFHLRALLRDLEPGSLVGRALAAASKRGAPHLKFGSTMRLPSIVLPTDESADGGGFSERCRPRPRSPAVIAIRLFGWPCRPPAHAARARGNGCFVVGIASSAGGFCGTLLVADGGPPLEVWPPADPRVLHHAVRPRAAGGCPPISPGATARLLSPVARPPPPERATALGRPVSCSCCPARATQSAVRPGPTPPWDCQRAAGCHFGATTADHAWFESLARTCGWTNAISGSALIGAPGNRTGPAAGVLGRESAGGNPFVREDRTTCAFLGCRARVSMKAGGGPYLCPCRSSRSDLRGGGCRPDGQAVSWALT